MNWLTLDGFRVVLKLAADIGGVLSHPALVGTKLYARVGARLVCVDLAKAND